MHKKKVYIGQTSADNNEHLWTYAHTHAHTHMRTHTHTP